MNSTETTRVGQIRAELNALYAEVASRPAVQAEKSILADLQELASFPGMPKFPSLLGLRMTSDDFSREEKLIAEHNEIAGRIRAARDARQQARVNAAEVSRVRAAACPVCFSTHAGEC